ncbi:hypothetical protein F5Y04DRAFT_52723 [Hypomontagnella monticulosa]|nr:hypothetical protein F5Y04DRAFT_52723 [Hypomontagnella monticulosa]
MELATGSGGLSILNPYPGLADGPNLLHNLVASASNDGLPAIEYRPGASDGNVASISYTELHSTVAALAARMSDVLRSLVPTNTQDQPVIPILVPQSPMLYVGLLAILKAGAAFCPLNLDTPRDRLRFILRDVGAKVVLVDSEFVSKLPVDDEYRVISIGKSLELVTCGVPKSAPYRIPGSNDLAYVMYTSGSTGTPKGVGISHLAATQSLLAHNRHIPPFSRFLQFAAPTFDVSVFEIFFPLFRGRTLVCCNRAEMLTDLPGVLKDMRVDGCELTPSVAGSLLKKRHNAPELKLLLTIGEMLTEPVVQEFGGDEQESSLLWGMYGPTEATIHCTLQTAFSKGSSKNNIGVPLDTVSAFVIDSDSSEFRVLPLGHIGELAVGGSQIATGYINRPEQTSAAFVETHWGRVYRTGDKARILPGGTIECLGRISGGQVKLNGQRIELGEVEHALLRTPGCHGAFADVISNVLVAFVAVEDGLEPEDTRAAILSQCKSWLPAFMIPADVKIMNNFPRLPSGKVDKKTLTKQYETAVLHAEEEVYEDELERRLCGIAETILGQRVAPSTRLSSLGLDSLAAIEYASTIRVAGININPIDVLDATTVRDLFHVIKAGRGTTNSLRVAESSLDEHQPDKVVDLLASDSAVHPHLDSVERVETCSPLQEAMVAETFKDARIYVNQTALHFPNHISVESIKTWFFTLARSNEILRTGFVYIDHKLHQVIWKHLDKLQVNIVDDAHTPECDNVEQLLLRPLRLQVIPSHASTTPHTVVLTLHHSIYDGWTIDLLIEDLLLLAHNKPLLQRPQYRLVSRHYVTTLGSDLIDAKEFWAGRLRDSVPTPLPNFRTLATPNPQILMTSKSIKVNPVLVRDFALSASIGPQVIFQASLAWLWGALNGVDDTIIGSVSSGRTLPIVGIEKIMGPCMMTLPLRTVFSRYSTIEELLQGIHMFNRETLRYGSLPLTEIKRAAGVPLAQKLFDIIFAYQETLASRRRDDDIICEAWHKDAVEAKLLVEILPLDDEFSCQITWHSDAFSESQIDTLVQHLDCLANYLITNSNQPLSSILRCFPANNLSRYNVNPTQLDVSPSLSALVEKAASKYPDYEALCFASSIGASSTETYTLSYQELNSRANRIARCLERSGATPGGVIALVMEKSPALYCAILGILKSGCGYLPILPSTPSQRIELILKQAQPQFCVVDESSPKQAIEIAPCPVINLACFSLSEYSDSNLDIHGSRNDLAYVIYTSGTTGIPKGVSVTNTNILSNIEVLSRIYPHEPSDRMLQACSQAFDMSVFEIFFAWANGMCLCSATNDIMFEDFERAVRAFRISHLGITVTVASLLEPSRVPDVKLLATAGEPMTDEVLEKWAEKLWQGYGPSETTNICTVRKVAPGDSSQYLGFSFENTSTFVFSPGTTDLMPFGCVGEFCFGGDQVAAGYLGMPELTADKFIDHPEYGRLYRSGDVGRMLPDGSLIILGRLDNQVKLRGLRIELQEIQATVLKTKVTKTCTSVPIIFGGSSTQQLALFYVPIGYEHSSFSVLPITGTTRQTMITIHQSLQAALPDYMVPPFIFPISALPLTSSGKIDYNLFCRSVSDLPDETLNLYTCAQDLNGESGEWSEAESLISGTISETVHIDRMAINRWSSFAALGIDSISAMPLARRLSTVFGKKIPLSLILSNPSVSRLASAITEASDTLSKPEERGTLLPELLIEAVRNHFTGLGEDSVEDVLPCTPLQEAMLSSSGLPKGESSYYTQMLFRLRVPSHVMQKHWDLMFERHGILRTCFVTTEDVQHPVVQVVLKAHSPTWKTIEADSGNLQKHVSDHGGSLSAPTDSSRPPVSLAIILLDGFTEYLSFVCHHAIYDGVSMRYLLAEIEAASHHEQLPAPLPFKSFLQETLPLPSGTDIFWADHLRSFSPVHFDKLTSPSDRDSNIVLGTSSGRSLSSITAQLRDLDASLLSLCQAAWAITLSLLQDTSDVCFGNVMSGRSIALDQIDTLVAPCFNTIPMRMNFSTIKFFHQAMKKFHRLNSEILPYQFTGLRRIQSQLPLSRLFDTILILQPHTEPLDGTIWSLEQEYGAMDVPLVCEVTPLKGQDILQLQLHRDPSFFSCQTASLILDVFQEVFDSCLEHPSSHILTTAKLPAHWQHQLSQLPLSQEIPQMDADNVKPTHSVNGEVWDKTEAIVRSVISKLANIPEERIERHTSIYRYGLDSIGAVQLATLLRRESCVVSAVDVIENPTCAGIAAQTATRDSKNGQFSYDFDSFQDAVSHSVNNILGLGNPYELLLPCTSTQQGMISQFLSSGGVRYFNYASWILETGVDPLQMVRAWSNLASHCQILRTGFVTVNHKDTSYAMVVYPKAGFSVPVSVVQTDDFNGSEWHAEAARKALGALSVPPWQVVIGNQSSGPSTIHLAMHHALYDADSLRKMLGLLEKALSGVIYSDPPPMQPALSSWLDPANSQSASEVFWKGKAKDLVVNKFPIMTPLQITDHMASITSRTCDTSSLNLRRSAAEAGITIRAVVQAAWTRVLSAYLGEASVTFGIVLDGRTTKEERDTIFPMVTTLPVLAHNTDSNAELLEYMMQYNTHLRRHEKTPLSKVQWWLDRPDGQLFDTIIAYQSTDVVEDSLPWKVLDEAASVEYTVALEVVETVSGGLQLNLTHDTDILPVEQANILLQQFDAIFVDLLTSPRGHARQLAHLEPSLFSVLPASHQELPAPAELLHQLVEQTAQRIPTATALEFVEELSDPIRRRSWTYRELDEMGNRVANMLTRRNTPPGSIVATCFNKCPAAYFSILGILKAGCAFLSLDPSAPVSRLEFILKDSAATCLLIELELSDALDININTPVCVVNEHDLLKYPISSQPPTHISPSNICYCLYTSGTTGTPKGCLISHDNTVQAMLAFEHLFSEHWDAHSRWLQFASFHFDVSVLEQYWSWYVGITVVAAPKDLILSDLTATISRLDITHIDLTPSLARLTHPDEVPSLCRGVFITGGEQLRQEILQVWGPKEVIYNAYGPTEATIGVTMFQRVPANGRSSNIGAQFPNVGSYVFEPGTEVPVLKGGVGELCVSGRLVGKGYLNRRDLTDERFPVLKQYGERVYRTGDLVRVLHDGSFDFLGRADDQVKLRGQRLEIGEINHAIKTGLSGELADVATFVTRHLGQDRDLLISFLAPVASSSLPTDLRICSDQAFLDMSRTALEACRDRLPGYMVPTYVLCVPFIPLSANNKADIKRLKQLFMELPHDHLRNLTMGSTGAQRALNEKEQLIALAISTMTQVDENDILPSSSIFELGIDSINVARLAIILQSRGLTLASPSLILRHPQLSRLSQALQQGNSITSDRQTLQAKQSIRAHYHRYIGTVCRTLGVNKADVEYIAPCTSLQEGMIARSRMAEAQPAYFNQFLFALDTEVSISRLNDCWNSVFAEYAILRTAFIATADGHIQVATRQNAIPWFHVDQNEKEVEDFMKGRLDRWITSNKDTIRHPIEIDYLEHSGKQTLILRLFHGVYDGHSFDLLLRRVNERYHHEPSVQSPAFIDVLHHGPLLKHSQSRPFWEGIFKDQSFRPILRLSEAPGTSDVSNSRVFQIDNFEARRIALGVTHQTMVQAAWLVALHQCLGFVPTIGVIFSGRSLVFDGIENVIGPVFNTLPFRVDLAGRTTWTSLVQGVQEYNTSVLDFVHTPLRDIQKWCSNGQPLFDTLLTFNREDGPSVTKEKPFWSSIHSTGTSDYPLALEVILSRDGSLVANIAARKQFGTEPAIASLLDQFSHTLSTLANSDSNSPLPSNLTTAIDAISATHVSDINPSDTESTTEPKLIQSGKAQEIRHEIASLAGLADEDILETTSLFELGLDSIDGIKLATRLKKLGLRITFSELMKNPTLKGIVRFHTALSVNGDDSRNGVDNLESTSAFLRDFLTRDGVDLKNATAVLPPTPLQDSMVADMLLSGFQRYFNHDVLEIPPETDISRLKSAWATVYANSPILRTTFAEIDNPSSKTAFCQIVRDVPLEFGQSEIPSSDSILTVIDQARDRAARANGAAHLFQLTFVTTPKSRYLVLSIAHALYDGWSLELLHKDVRAAYDGHYHARDAYGPYLSHLIFGSPVASESFWANYLNDARPTLLDLVMELHESREPIVHRSELTSTVNPQGLKTLCQKYRITPQVLAQGCWAPVLASMAKSLDVIFGVVLSGRDTNEAQELMFPTMNTVPLRIVLHGTAAEYFSYLQATMSDIMEFQHLPLRQVQKVANFKGERLFNTLFLLQNAKEHQDGLGSPIMQSVHTSSAVDYPVCIEMEVTKSSVIWRIAGDERYVSLEGAHNLLNDIENVLHHFAGDHVDVLEFRGMSEEVSVCGLESFKIRSTMEDGARATLMNGSSDKSNSTSLESPVLDVLSELSGVDRHTIDLDHSIYHLGLDSISAIKASSMLRRRGLDISVRNLLKAASIRGILASPMGQTNKVTDHPTNVSSRLNTILDTIGRDSLFKSVGVDQTEVEAVLPALPMQVHMLSVWKNTGGVLFFPRFIYELHGKINGEGIAKAWSILVAENPLFRTRFAATESAEIPVAQIITNSQSIDNTTRSPSHTEQGKWTYEEAFSPYFFVRVDHLHPDGARMYIHIHHALYDGVSLPAIMGRFLELCNNISAPTPNVHQPRWYEFVSDHYSPDIRQKRQEFWTSYLQKADPVRLLAQQQPSAGGEKAQQLAQLRRKAINDVSKLKMTSSAKGTTLQAFFFATYSKVLAALQGTGGHAKGEDGQNKDAVFGIYLANRTSFGGLENAPFPTLNIVPLIVRQPLIRPIAELAMEIQKDLLEISNFENAGVGLWEIYNWTGIQIDSSVNFLATPADLPIMDTKSSVTMTEVTGEAGWISETIDSIRGVAQPREDFTSRDEVGNAFMHTIDVEVAVHDNAMDIGVFCPSSFSESRAKGLIETLITTLKAV